MNMVMVPLAEATVARLIATKVDGESLGDTVTRLLRSRDEPAISARSSEMSVVPSEPLKSEDEAIREQPSKPTTRGKQQLVLFGQEFHFRDKIDVWRTFMRELIGLVPDKLDALMAVRFHPRRILARTKAELYGGRTDLSAEQVAPGLWIPKNCGVDDHVRNIRAACRAIGLEFGKDVIESFV